MDILDYVIIAIKLIVGLSILNVWLFRANKKTAYRGGEASTLKEEFATYGLPEWMMYSVGAAKILLSAGLIASIYWEILTPYAAFGLAAFMAGAVVMHLKVSDNFTKTYPAATFLLLSGAVGAFSLLA